MTRQPQITTPPPPSQGEASPAAEGPDFSDGCDHEGFPGGCERFGHTIETCPAAPPSGCAREGEDAELLDFLTRKRFGLVPEYEGPWDVIDYRNNDEGVPWQQNGKEVCVASGNTAREAIRAAIASTQDGGAR